MRRATCTRCVAAPLVAAVLLAPALGCGGARPAWRPLEGARDGDRVEVTGRVRLVGSMPAPWVMVEPDSGSAVRITGASVEPVLRRLGELRVRVRGRLRAQAGTRAVEAEEWRLEALPDGSTPVLGVVGVRAGGVPVLELDGGDALRLTGELAGTLREFAGAWVWVAGEATGGASRSLLVRAYGILDEAGRPPGVSKPRHRGDRVRRR